MKTILIAEDEKMIRRGLCTMVRRASVPVEKILEAQDGIQALEMLQTEPVDLLITDVRMPNLDGIGLVERVRQLEHPPLVLVVSGYDDFSYAVSMLRNGVQDYLLKPVERQKLYEALRKIEEKLNSRQQEQQSKLERYNFALRYLMLDESHDRFHREGLIREFSAQFYSEPYLVICTRAVCADLHEVIILEDMDGWRIYLGKETMLAEVEWNTPTGQSCAHQGMEQLNQAYIEAVTGWKQAFFRGSGRCIYEPRRKEHRGVTADHLTDLVQLGRWREIVSKLRHLFDNAGAGRMDPDEVAELCGKLADALASTWQGLLEKGESPRRYQNLWTFDTSQQYLDSFSEWLEQMALRIGQEFADHERKQKIRQAIKYVQNNFREPINMAMVSNYVSMNYSLFSLLFKQYTGSNFVGYLQNLRIEEAKRLLTETDMRVNEISIRAGFVGEKHFLKVFKTATGFSPTEWRKVSRQKLCR